MRVRITFELDDDDLTVPVPINEIGEGLTGGIMGVEGESYYSIGGQDVLVRWVAVEEIIDAG